MTPEIHTWVAHRVHLGILPNDGARILEVGSRNVNGVVRPLFSKAYSYCGVDLEAGPGVDRVVYPHQPLGEESFDLAICLEVLEHDPKPWITVEQMRRALNPGGVLLISVPTTGFPEHRHPHDCFRFMRDAFSLWIFEGMRQIALDEVRCPAGYPGLIGAAIKL